MAVARALELGKEEIGCVSTGNVGTATAALAAKAGLRPYVFYPANLERAKARSCRALGAQVCELDGNYDEANRACRELALASGIEFANITLRPFYAEGAKTLAYEVVEQLDWLSPDHIVMPAAGGTLSSRVHKGLNELEAVGLAQTAADQAPRRPADRLLSDRDCDRRGQRGDRAPGARDAGALAGDRRARRRPAGARGRAQPRRLRRGRRRRGDHRGDGAARRHRGGADRARRRHHPRRDDEARPAGRPWPR